MAPVTVNQLADYILCCFRDKSEEIDHLKLQKLVYYCQAWRLALYGEPLFDGEIQAWIHGPVQPNLYSRFKSFQWRPIILRNLECPQLSRDIKDHIDEIMQVYADYSGEELESIVHQEAPWANAREGLLPLQSSRKIINEKDMEDFYYKMAQT